jgi:hypothetical protein
LKAIWLFLSALLPFTDCWGSGSFSRAFPPGAIPITIPALHDVLDAGDGGVIVLSSSPQTIGERRIVRIRGGAEEQLAALPSGHYTDGEALFLTGTGRWWYSRPYGGGSNSSIYFVTSEAAGVMQRKFDLRDVPLLWLPLRGEKPGGVMLSLGPDRSTFYLDEVSDSGTRPLGSYPGHLPGTAPSSRDWSAERLPDGRVAVLSIEQSTGGPSRFMLRVLDGNGGIAEAGLPCADQFREALITAMDRAGRIAAVALSPKGELVSTTISVDEPQSTRCRVLSMPGETVANPNLVSPSVIAAGDELIAAWIRSDGTVRACQIGNQAAPINVVDVGRNAETQDTLAHLVSADGGETVTFTWKTDRGIVMRRMPAALDGYALVTEIERLCSSLMRAARQQ